MWFMNEKWRKNSALIGAHFTLAPLGYFWSYGNLAPYLNSYFRFYCSPSCVDGNSQWVFNLFLASISIGMLGAGRLIGVVPLRLLCLTGCLFCGVAIMVSAWMVDVSVIGTSVFLGVLNGIGLGGLLNTAMACANGWAPETSAFYSGTMTGLPPVLAFVQNQMITAYVNPKNLKPDVQESSSAYFSQPDVLRRVPNAILILGGITLGLQLIGVFLISDPPKCEKRFVSVNSNHKIPQTTNSSKSPRQPLRAIDGNGVYDITTQYGSSRENQKQSDIQVEQSNGLSDQALCSMNTPRADTPGSKLCVSIEPEPLYSCTAAQAIKSRAFWVNSMYMAVLVYGCLLKNGYFKVFGLLYIPDDNLLTILGSLIPLAEAGVRLVFGILINKGIVGLQDSLVLSLSLNAALFSLFYFAPQLNFVTYLVLILMLSIAHGKMFVLYTSFTFKVFGPAHFAKIYALGCPLTGMLMLVHGGISTIILDSLGWFWLFMTCSVLSTLVLVAAVVTDVRPNLAARLH